MGRVTARDGKIPQDYARRNFIFSPQPHRKDPFRHRFAMTPPPMGEAASLHEGGVTPPGVTEGVFPEG